MVTEPTPNQSNQSGSATTTALDALCINTIRTLAMDAVEKANSGHPGTPMEAASLAYLLWTRHLRINPKNTMWPGRDRFVLSAGHASMLLYSMLYLTGFDIELDELKNFRQFGSRTPGHPERHPEIGIETTTGPLGQGFGNGVGMAIAQRYLAERFSRPGFEDIFDHNIYAFCSDGDIQEGISHETAAIAGHLKLGSMVYVYLDNHITIEGSTELSMSENVGARFEAYGWHVQHVQGEDHAAIDAAYEAARAERERPSIIIARTHIAIGSPNKQDTAEAHGAPLGKDEVAATKANLGWPSEEAFYVPEESLTHMRRCVERGQELEAAWKSRWDAYRHKYPELATEWERIDSGILPEGWEKDLPSYDPSAGEVATRNASGDAINAIAARVPELIGGSADLAPSNNTNIKGAGDFTSELCGRNLHFGIREHGMGAILNGIAFTSGLIPFGGTFLIFSDYMRPTLRLASMSKDHVIYVYTHDSIGLGEDGPTHQPIEHLASLRAIPGLVVIRPSDANETVEAWRTAISAQAGPVAIVLTRQKLPVFERDGSNQASMLSKGAYVLADLGVESDNEIDLILIATGSEVAATLAAGKELNNSGLKVRVVAMPSWELFAAQPESYRQSVLPRSVRKRVSVEAAATMGWERWVGIDGLAIGIDHFGASAPIERLMDEFGFTTEKIVTRINDYLKSNPS